MKPRETRFRAYLADGSHADELIEHVRLDHPDGTKTMWALVPAMPEC